MGSYHPEVDALAVAQRKLERIMLGITVRDRKHDTVDPAADRSDMYHTSLYTIKKLKPQLMAARIARVQGNRGTIRATDWLYPENGSDYEGDQ